MADIQHYCYNCNIKLNVTRHDSDVTVSCPRCDFIREYHFKTAAERQAKVRKNRKKKSVTPIRTGRIHARTTRCPECLGLLKKINLNQTTARKGCLNCERKFDYTRTDTPEGRKLRVEQWREKKNAERLMVD